MIKFYDIMLELVLPVLFGIIEGLLGVIILITAITLSIVIRVFPIFLGILLALYFYHICLE